MTKSFSTWQQQQHVDLVWHKMLIKRTFDSLGHGLCIVSRWQLFFQIEELRKAFEKIQKNASLKNHS
jgi:hypothetical protein